MTPDLLDELRTLDPVERDRLRVPDSLLRPPPRRRAPVIAAAAGIATAAAVVVLATGGDESRLSLAARAYAATSGPGVVHWVSEIANYRDGDPAMRQRQQGWTRGTTSHVLDYNRDTLVTDMRTANGRTRAWGVGSNDYTDRRAAPGVIADPFAAFRRAFEQKRLTQVGPGRYRLDARARTVPEQRIEFQLDPKTARPLRQVITSTIGAGPGRAAHRFVTVIRYTRYERLPDTASNRAKLLLLPHPGAGASKTDPRTVFEPLRRGPRPTVRQRALVQQMARSGRFRLTPGDARRAGRGVVLIPGRGYVCAMVGGAGTCATVDNAVRRGLAFGSTRRGMYVVVPDGVSSLRARVPRHPWRRFDARDNVVHLPNNGYRYRLR